MNNLTLTQRYVCLAGGLTITVTSQGTTNNKVLIGIELRQTLSRVQAFGDRSANVLMPLKRHGIDIIAMLENICMMHWPFDTNLIQITPEEILDTVLQWSAKEATCILTKGTLNCDPIPSIWLYIINSPLTRLLWRQTALSHGELQSNLCNMMLSCNCMLKTASNWASSRADTPRAPWSWDFGAAPAGTW